MIGRRLVNGSETAGISPDDRGLQYGDGLFETMAATGGRIRRLGAHLARLADGCRRLGIPMPSEGLLTEECDRVLAGMGNGTVKLTVTRGPGPRGYRPPAEPAVTRIVQSSAPRPRGDTTPPLVVRMCETRLGLNPALAGLKHLNRLEQVMACAEWDDPAIGEGLMLSMDGRLIAATAGNLFLVEQGRLVTPAIRDCGIAGIMRQAVLDAALGLGIGAVVTDVLPDRLATADEVFITNAVSGIRPVAELDGSRHWAVGPVTRALLAHTAG
ncbi:MAG: aminodeoxychorismate lyase [Steroidobacteraceae bacterium]